MDLKRLPKTFDRMATRDPYWAALTERSDWTSEDFFVSGRQHVERVLSTARSLRPIGRGAALDFGCGPGRLVQALCNHFDSVVGVDISDKMLAKAREMNRFPDKCRYVLNHTPRLQFADESFDLVHTTMVLQHIQPGLALGYMREFIRILKAGGMAIFQVPEKPKPGIEGLILRVTPVPWLRPIRHIDMYGHREASVRQTVESAGGFILLKESCVDAGHRWVDWRYYAVRKD